MTTVVPSVECLIDLISLVDRNDRFFDFPKVLGADIVTYSAELALDADARRIVRTRVNGVERRATLRVGVMVVVREVASAMIKPKAKRTTSAVVSDIPTAATPRWQAQDTT